MAKWGIHYLRTKKVVGDEEMLLQYLMGNGSSSAGDYTQNKNVIIFKTSRLRTRSNSNFKLNERLGVLVSLKRDEEDKSCSLRFTSAS